MPVHGFPDGWRGRLCPRPEICYTEKYTYKNGSLPTISERLPAVPLNLLMRDYMQTWRTK